MCINYVHNDRFLIIWKTFFVQCSYAKLLLLQSGSPHNQTAADCFIDNVGAVETMRNKKRVTAPTEMGHRVPYLQRMAKPNGSAASNCSRRASFTMIARGEGRPRFLLPSVEVRT